MTAEQKTQRGDNEVKYSTWDTATTKFKNIKFIVPSVDINHSQSYYSYSRRYNSS